MEIGKHFFIFSYMIAFFLGIIVMTLNWLLYRKVRITHLKGVQFFYIILFIHIVINFIYFYKAYFIALWEWRLVILLMVNISLVISLTTGLHVISPFLQEEEKRRDRLLLALGAFYVISYSFIRWIHPNAAVTFHGIGHSLIFVGSNFLFTLAGCIYCLKYMKKILNMITTNDDRFLLILLNAFIGIYLIFNFVIDTYYGMIEDKARLWGINAYHLSIYIYLGWNVLWIISYYRRIVYHSEGNEFNKMEVESAETEQVEIEIELPEVVEPEEEGLLTLDMAAEIYHLTSREKELAALVFAGYGNSKIAETLCISENTVKRHLSNIYHKMEINNRVELIKRLKP